MVNTGKYCRIVIQESGGISQCKMYFSLKKCNFLKILKKSSQKRLFEGVLNVTYVMFIVLEVISRT